MGVTQNWVAEVSSSLLELGINYKADTDNKLNLLILEQGKLVLNLVPMANDYEPGLLLYEQDTLQKQGILLIQLWEDIWLRKKEQVLSRITSLLGKNKKLHGRKTKLITLDQAEADNFLLKFHLQGSAKTRFKYGLLYEDELVAVATFSGTRIMKSQGADYRSTELVRFACKSGITVTGGLSKLLKHYINLINPSDIMSYADRDWSVGSGYESCGFVLKEIREPSYLWLDQKTMVRYFPHRKPEVGEQEDFVKIFNTGNLKYMLYL